MKRLTKLQLNQMQNLIRQGKSLNQISKKLNIGKTTIYYHMRQLVGRKIKQITIDRSSEEKIGEFVGLFAGDGSYFFEKRKYLHQIRIHLNKNEKEIIKHYKKIIEDIFHKSPNLYYTKSLVILEIKSKVVIDFLKCYLEWRKKKTFTVELKDYKKLSVHFIKGFLRGLIDSDGYVRQNRREIYFGTTSFGLNKNFTDSLKLMNFNFKCYTQVRQNRHIFYKTRLSNQEVIKFIQTIQPIKASGLTGI